MEKVDIESLPFRILACQIRDTKPLGNGCGWRKCLVFLLSRGDSPYHIFSLPFFQDHYYEKCLGPLTKQEAHRRFRQKDHSRLFSVNSLDNTFGMDLKRDLRDFIPLRYFQPNEPESINSPRRFWEVLEGSKTIALRKGDTHFPT